VLITGGGELRLFDFGAAVRSHSSTCTPYRFFRLAGKPMYIAPEVYVPPRRAIPISCSASSMVGAIAQVPWEGYHCQVKIPCDAVVGRDCQAEVCGYEAQPHDVFGCGVLCFALTMNDFPYGQCYDPRYPRLLIPCLPGLNEHFKYVYQFGPDRLTETLRQMMQRSQKSFASVPGEDHGFELITSMLAWDPVRRPTASEVLEQLLRLPELQEVEPDHKRLRQ
jgi:serine/threonine protein kinase